MNFRSKSGGPKDEQFEFIAADVFLRGFIIELQSANLVLIAPEADVFFRVAGEIDCRCNLDGPCSGFLVMRISVAPLARANVRQLFDWRHRTTVARILSFVGANTTNSRVSGLMPSLLGTK
jgi:hypothetical protein